MEVYERNSITRENVNMMFPDWDCLQVGVRTIYPKRFYYVSGDDGGELEISLRHNKNGYVLSVYDNEDLLFEREILLARI